MSNPEFANLGNALGRFIEECGEALAAAGKTVRFGWDSHNPLPGKSAEDNEDWLKREIGDLEEAIARLKKTRGWVLAAPPIQQIERRDELRAACIKVVHRIGTPIPSYTSPQHQVDELRKRLELCGTELSAAISNVSPPAGEAHPIEREAVERFRIADDFDDMGNVSLVEKYGTSSCGAAIRAAAPKSPQDVKA